jgi:hypothetical protein
VDGHDVMMGEWLWIFTSLMAATAAAASRGRAWWRQQERADKAYDAR